MPFSMKAGADDDGRRLDRILRKALPDLPLSAIHRLLRKGVVLINGETCAADYHVSSGEIITINFKQGQEPKLAARSRDHKKDQNPVPLPGGKNNHLEILFEGAGLLVLNKPAGLPVHGRQSLEDLVHAYLLPKLPRSLSFKPGPLHRLDEPSSGIIAFSASISGARFFSALMRERKIKKQYIAIVEGRIEKVCKWQDELIRDNVQKKTFTPHSCKTGAPESSAKPAGKTAITRVTPLMKTSSLTLILAQIETGRTHQIRAQAAIRGHPLLGDKKYGSNARGSFLLHAWCIEFSEQAHDCPAPLPRVIKAPLPENFREKIRELFGRDFEKD